MESEDRFCTECGQELEKSAPTTEEVETDVETDLPSTVWHKAIGIATAGWIVLVVGVNVLPEAVFGLLFLVSWPLLPAALYMDIKEVEKSVDWPEYKWAYIGTSIIWIAAIIPGIVYLWKRHNVDAISSAKAPVGTSVTEQEGKVVKKRPQEVKPETEKTKKETVSIEDRSLDIEGVDSEFQSTNIEYDGDRYHCQYSKSPNGQWRIAYGRSLHTGDNRAFLFEEENLRFSEPLEIAASLGGKAAVSNTGVAAVLDNLEREELSGKLYVFNSSGEKVLTHLFNSNVETCAVTGDGEYVAAATLNPDCSTYIFDLEREQQILKHENEEGNMMRLEFRGEDDELRLYLFENREEEPIYAIDLEGKIVWKSDELKRKERLQELMDSGETEDLEEALERLEEAYELAKEENEKKNVARKLAETHWSLARETDRDEDYTKWWGHLNQAKAYYMEVLPWYDGKQGVAKVSRKQGKYYLKQGNEESALTCFQTITDLEEEYDVQLLTDADKRRLKELSKK